RSLVTARDPRRGHVRQVSRSEARSRITRSLGSAWSRWTTDAGRTEPSGLNDGTNAMAEDRGPRPSCGPVGSAGAAGLALVVDRATGVVEQVVEHATEGEDHDDDQRGDAGDQQAVLDGGRAALVLLG